ncbi:MAG: division/cell wall cluster transcriptional repressor MraZ [Treponemataceae bacterium]
MAILTGEYKNNLDEKGRVSFPAKLRTSLGGTAVTITRGVDKCLWVFPKDAWNVFLEKVMSQASLFQAQSRSVLRRLVAPAQEVEIDKQGRISIPQSLREYAGLEKECLVLGISKYLEIWSVDGYEAYLKESETDFLKAAEALGNVCFG